MIFDTEGYKCPLKLAENDDVGETETDLRVISLNARKMASLPGKSRY